jgi:uncharacterized protein YraI
MARFRWMSMVTVVMLMLFGLQIASADDLTVTALTTVNVRSGPSTDYTAVGRLFVGDQATATGRDSTGNDWYRITFTDLRGDSREGWVAAGFVALDGDPTTLTIVEGASGTTYTGNTGVVVETENAVNVRLGPGTEYRSPARTATNGRYDVQGYTALDDVLICRSSRILNITTGEEERDGVWLLIDFNGIDAWVNYGVVSSISGDLCALSTVTVDDAELPIEVTDEEIEEVEQTLFGTYIITLDRVNLRETNFAESDIITIIPSGVRLFVEAQDEGGDRLRVTYQGDTGWVARGFVELVQGNLSDIPVEQE